MDNVNVDINTSDVDLKPKEEEVIEISDGGVDDDNCKGLEPNG